MPFLTWRPIYFSREAGGGDPGAAIGIVRNTMIMDGLIIAARHPGTAGYPMAGEIIIEAVFGVVVLGIPLRFITIISIGIGVVVNGGMTMAGDSPAADLPDAPSKAADRVDATCKAVDLPGGPSRAADRVDGTYKAVDLPGGASRAAVLVDGTYKVADLVDGTYEVVDLVLEGVVPAVFTEWGR